MLEIDSCLFTACKFELDCVKHAKWVELLMLKALPFGNDILLVLTCILNIFKFENIGWAHWVFVSSAHHPNLNNMLITKWKRNFITVLIYRREQCQKVVVREQDAVYKRVLCRSTSNLVQDWYLDLFASWELFQLYIYLWSALHPVIKFLFVYLHPYHYFVNLVPLKLILLELFLLTFGGAVSPVCFSK